MTSIATRKGRIPISLVVAVGSNGVIGTGGRLPWRVKADLKKFRSVTMGKPLIMGRKTFESIGRVLDGRDIIVATRRPSLAVKGVFVAASLEEAFVLAEERARARGALEICVVGGGEIYRAALPFADRLHVSYVAAAPDGDTYFPKITPAEWAEVSREGLAPSGGDTTTAVHVVYRRKR